MRPGLKARAGLGALLAIMFFVALVATVLAFSVPVLLKMDRTDRAIRTSRILFSLDSAISNGGTDPDFLAVVGRYPGRLSELVVPIKNTDVNSCGATFSGGQVNNWPGQGPFSHYAIDATDGIGTPLGGADNVLVRNPAGGGAGTLAITIGGDSEDADALDRVVDGGDGRSAGKIQWTAPATDGSTTISYLKTITNSC